MTKLSLL